MPNIENSPRSAARTGGDGDDGGVSDGGHAGDGGRTVLRASGVEKAYGSALPFVRRVEVLDGVDLALRAGELVGVVGENGSGKSTLLKLLVGALDADAGGVTVEGTVGWCPQEPLLYDRLTVAETFRLFGEAYGVSRETVDAALEEYGDRLEFAAYRDRQVRHLSGGNRQKVNLAVALLHDPDVLLLDEPYTGFDWETFLAFWELAGELTDRGTAVVVISHLVHQHDRFDRVLELRDGRLHEATGDAGRRTDDG